MASKLMAARNISLGGIASIIANGTRPNILKDIFSGKSCGTIFLPEASALNSRQQWIAFTKKTKGTIIIDDGAENALTKNGKSLLPSGITAVQGRFSMGDSVVIQGKNKRKIAIGMVNYNSGDLKKIIGAKTSRIEAILGYRHDDEIVHRDNLILEFQLEQ
jgi:glutamate 5-kinase